MVYEHNYSTTTPDWFSNHHYVCLLTVISTLILLLLFCCFASTVTVCWCKSKIEAKRKQLRREERRAEKEKRKHSYWSKKFAANSPHYEYWQQHARDSQSSKQGLPISLREMFRKESARPSFASPAIFAPITPNSRRGSYEIA